MNKRQWLLGVAALATGLATANAAWAEGLKLGAIVPLTGDLQAYGEIAVNGFNLAINEINAAGGVNGGPITMVVADSHTNPQQGVDAAQRMVTLERVNAILGALASGVTIPIAQSVSKVHRIPQVSGASTSPVITGLDDDDFLFRTVPSDAGQGVALAQVAKERGVERVAILYVNNDYGRGLADAFAGGFTALGGTVTQSVAFEQNQAAYRGELQTARGDGATHLLLVSYPESGITILRQALEGDFFDKFIFTDGMKAQEIITAIGAEYMEGTFGTTPMAVESDSTAAFRAAWIAAYGDDTEKPYNDTHYDAVYLLALAAQKAGTNDSVAIRDALRSVANPPGVQVGPGDFARAIELLAAGEDIDYEGASGGVNIDSNGDVAGSFEEFEIQNGAYATLRVFEPSMD